MKKYLFLILILITVFITGCGKKTETDIYTEEVKDLRSTDNRIVYKNGDLYMIVFHYDEENNITGEEFVYQYDSNKLAKQDYESKKELYSNSTSFKDAKVVDNYVIYILKDEEYQDLTVDDIKTKYASLTEVK